RGVSDDKAPVIAMISAIGQILRDKKTLPINIKFLIEGEEEIGSENLPSLLKEHADLLATNLIIVGDTSHVSKDIPAICSALRGLTYLEVTATGPNTDLHSGTMGGIVPNPIHALATLINGFKNHNNQIIIPDFYKEVLDIDPKVRDELTNHPHADLPLKTSLGISTLIPEKGFSPLEALTMRPTLDCNGIFGGYIGKGAKTVIPSSATAKISMRLVPNQDPWKIADQCKDYIYQNIPNGISIEIVDMHHAKPVQLDTSFPAVKVLKTAMEKTYGRAPLCLPEGGSIPIISELKDILTPHVVMMGFRLPDDQIHAPNERYSLDIFEKSMQVMIEFITRLNQATMFI
ncbi:MAG: M20/M25/M40 family metallo-hydrolase, partial [Candidatus Margulisbacteria bacterium]|nr:M20/M25/M40 family metallo-hydrolase [Candidatus Margulisiibacteriota bacterium]